MEKQKRTPPTAPAATHSAPSRPVRPDSSDAWQLDPGDVARHARLRRQDEQLGRLGKTMRYSAFALALAAAGAVYWNFDTLRHITVQAPALAALLKSASPDDAGVRASGAPDSAQVESSPVLGTAAPTSVSSARTREQPLEVAKAEGQATPAPEPHEAPASASPPAPETASAERSVAATPAVEPPPPTVPETIAFALPKFDVSERDAFAAIVVVRNGGNRGPSVFTWWTSDGTAKAGSDYVDLGRVVVKFAAGEQNRVINVPIVGDQVAEGPESFYVNLAPGDDASAEPQDRVEVVIEDDDEQR